MAGRCQQRLPRQRLRDAGRTQATRVTDTPAAAAASGASPLLVRQRVAPPMKSYPVQPAAVLGAFPIQPFGQRTSAPAQHNTVPGITDTFYRTLSITRRAARCAQTEIRPTFDRLTVSTFIRSCPRPVRQTDGRTAVDVACERESRGAPNSTLVCVCVWKDENALISSRPSNIPTFVERAQCGRSGRLVAFQRARCGK
ncbi:hypothetical protein BD414DRAFT_38289 [Trametes punicea]|nr:hypothetical protein BD414DRAFT_38289 [Trametes punicea]